MASADAIEIKVKLGNDDINRFSDTLGKKLKGADGFNWRRVGEIAACRTLASRVLTQDFP